MVAYHDIVSLYPRNIQEMSKETRDVCLQKKGNKFEEEKFEKRLNLDGEEVLTVTANPSDKKRDAKSLSLSLSCQRKWSSREKKRDLEKKRVRIELEDAKDFTE